MAEAPMTPPLIEVIAPAPFPFHSGLTVPARFVATFADPGSPYEVQLEVMMRRGRPEIDRVLVGRRNVTLLPEVTAVGLRGVNLKRLLKRALEAAAQPNDGRSVTDWRDAPDGATVFVAPNVATSSDRRHASASKKVAGSPLRRRGPEEFTASLAAFAEAYREARAGRQPVKEAACRAAGLTGTGSFGRYLREAIDRGLLDTSELA